MTCRRTFPVTGKRLIQTPNVDRLAREGTRFANAFVTAPVCSPCRSALITGHVPDHHRGASPSQRPGRGLKIHLPPDVTPVPKLLQQAGYFTCIGSGVENPGQKGKGGGGLGKTDYNFEWDTRMYDAPDWAGRKAGQPFFMQVQTHGGKMRAAARRRRRRSCGSGRSRNWAARPIRTR
jgi:arylsulfatase A-like enzyme